MIRQIKLFTLLFSIIIVSCQNNPKESNIVNQPEGNQKALVKEVIQTSAYTYLRVEKNNQNKWIAITKQDIQQGSTVYYKEGLKMENFTSPELQRTFETVYFVQEISDSPIQPKMPLGITGTEPKKPVLSKLDIKIEQPDGGISITDLYAKRETYSGKTIKVKGQVTKVNIAIMGRNWVHIQDGTVNGENFDLTITTVHEPKVGDVVTYSGTLILNKDFGSGYSYELLLENASPIETY
jgi:hypothetical protein